MKKYVLIDASERFIGTLQEALGRAEASVVKADGKIFICEIINVVTRKVSAETHPFDPTSMEPEASTIAHPKMAMYIIATPDCSDKIFPPLHAHGKELRKWYRDRCHDLPMDWDRRPAIRADPDYTE